MLLNWLILTHRVTLSYLILKLVIFWIILLFNSFLGSNTFSVVLNRFRASQCVCCPFFLHGCKLRNSVSPVCILLDVKDCALLLQHTLAADGRPGTLPYHPAAHHAATNRSELTCHTVMPAFLNYPVKVNLYKLNKIEIIFFCYMLLKGSVHSATYHQLKPLLTSDLKLHEHV